MADEHHQTRNAEKNYIATTVGKGVVLGAAVAETPGTDDLTDELTRRPAEPPGQSAQPWFGCLEHLGLSITEEDIAEARREMWGNFPREVH